MTAVVESAPTSERLLDAAEQLFAERGIDAVSVRAVNAAAGANVAAVHYHFGSKDALVGAVLRRRMDRLAERRRTMLAALPTDAPPTVRAVVQVLVDPLAELAGDPHGRGRAYVRVLAALQGGGPDARALMAEAFAPQFPPLDAAFARALPELPDAVRRFRLDLIGLLVVQTLADPGAAAASLGVDPDDHAQPVVGLIDAAVGMLGAPVTNTRKGSRR